MIGAAGRADAGVFLARLLRLDPAALVRLRRLAPGPPGPALGPAPGLAQMWAMLPFDVLVTRAVAEVDVETDVTVEAGALLRSLDEPAGAPLRRRDESWRWALPASRGRVVERLPAAEVARVAAAASRTLRAASGQGVGGRAVGERALRDALLDHVPIVVTGADPADRVEVPQRLVQAVARMGFLGPAAAAELTTLGDTSITVRRVGTWICLGASYGSAWYRPNFRLMVS